MSAVAPRPGDADAPMGAPGDALARAEAALVERAAEVERLTRELEETNSGVLALYAELEDTAEALRRASGHKTAFLSNTSHELRTPLSSIMNLARMLLEEGALGDEERRQAQFIQKAAQSLFEIVNDLLDLAKIEAGRVDLHVSDVDVADLLGTLRGVFRPLLRGDVELVVEPPPPGIVLRTDEGKLAQVLRNFLSNAVKYTTTGEIRVSVAADADGGVTFRVRDSGIGIAPEHHDRVFDEFAQVPGAHQTHVKGTGLGLPLSRRLAGLLGGSVALESAPGHGSTFILWLPVAPPTPTREPGDA